MRFVYLQRRWGLFACGLFALSVDVVKIFFLYRRCGLFTWPALTAHYADYLGTLIALTILRLAHRPALRKFPSPSYRGGYRSALKPTYIGMPGRACGSSLGAGKRGSAGYHIDDNAQLHHDVGPRGTVFLPRVWSWLRHAKLR